MHPVAMALGFLAGTPCEVGLGLALVGGNAGAARLFADGSGRCLPGVSANVSVLATSVVWVVGAARIRLHVPGREVAIPPVARTTRPVRHTRHMFAFASPARHRKTRLHAWKPAMVGADDTVTRHNRPWACSGMEPTRLVIQPMLLTRCAQDGATSARCQVAGSRC